VKIEKNPITNVETSEVLLFNREYPMTMGISGSTHGEITEAIPARNENRNPMFILSLNYPLNHLI
jgi:hypothetical protein